MRDLYAKRVADVRFLIPVLNGLTRQDIKAALPKLIKLNPEVVKKVFNRLLGVGTGDSQVKEICLFIYLGLFVKMFLFLGALFPADLPNGTGRPSSRPMVCASRRSPCTPWRSSPSSCSNSWSRERFHSPSWGLWSSLSLSTPTSPDSQWTSSRGSLPSRSVASFN